MASWDEAMRMASQKSTSRQFSQPSSCKHRHTDKLKFMDQSKLAELERKERNGGCDAHVKVKCVGQEKVTSSGDIPDCSIFLYCGLHTHTWMVWVMVKSG